MTQRKLNLWLSQSVKLRRNPCSNSTFEAIKTQIKIMGLLSEKRGQVIKSLSEEKNVFAGMGYSEVFNSKAKCEPDW